MIEKKKYSGEDPKIFHWIRDTLSEKTGLVDLNIIT